MYPILLVLVAICWTGPQREIFPGGTKIDATPPKLGEELTINQKKGLHSNLVPFFAQN